MRTGAFNFAKGRECTSAFKVARSGWSRKPSIMA